jgi:hypothetical protein
MLYHKEDLYVSTWARIKHYHTIVIKKKINIFKLFKERKRLLILEIKNINYSIVRTTTDELYDLFLDVLRNLIRPHRYKNLIVDIFLFFYIIIFIPKIIKARRLSKRGNSFLK